MSVSPNLIARSTTSKAWKAAPDKELNRLSSDNQTSDWRLPGGVLDRRTRGKPFSIFGDKSNSNSSDNESGSCDGSVSKESSDEDVLKAVDMNAICQPVNDKDEMDNGDPTRAILELKCLRTLLERTSKCGKCNSAVKVEFKSCCLNTYCRMTCVNRPACMRDF